jgi:radical SAM protein with 4Fe4S-binding SPASM domain
VLAWEETQKMIPSPIVNRISTSINRPLDEAGLARLKKGEFILSVSIDGNRHTQNRQRPFKDGRGSFDEIIANLRKIKAQHPELITVARMTVHSQAATILDELKELRALNLFDYCSIYCAAVEDETTGQVMMSDEFRQNYLTMAAEYNQLIQEDNNIFKGCLELNRYLSHILHGTGVHHHCRAGNGYFTLSPDGTVHPCHRFIGDVSEAIPGGLAALQTVLPNWKKSVGEKPECADCTIRYFCGGGCNQENYITNGDLLTPAAGGCAFAELLFEAALSAAISLNESTRTSLLNSTKELPRLFVFCGQVVHKF